MFLQRGRLTARFSFSHTCAHAKCPHAYCIDCRYDGEPTVSAPFVRNTPEHRARSYRSRSRQDDIEAGGSLYLTGDAGTSCKWCKSRVRVCSRTY